MTLAIKKIGPGHGIAPSKYDFFHRLPPVYLDFDPMPMKFFQRVQTDLKRNQEHIKSMVFQAFVQWPMPLAPRLR
jgi:hypothetical protein